VRSYQTNRSSPAPAYRTTRPQICAVLCCALLLPGCAWFTPDAGMNAVADIAAQDLNKSAAALRTPEDALAARAAVSQLLRRPLAAGAAVQIALLNNRGLQAAYAEVAAAEARRVGASLPPSPTLSLFRVAGSPAIWCATLPRRNRRPRPPPGWRAAWAKPAP
jgi:hypothetical protein